MEHPAISQLFRITAFVDILGWSTLTGGIDSRTLRKMKKEARLTDAELDDARKLAEQVERAQQLDQAVRNILSELRELARPVGEVAGVPDAKHFWENRHVTFVRFSDNIFLHSGSFPWILLFVSELLKRGLERGVLFRAGLSCGVVVHRELGMDPDLDVRSRDVSLFGDGITTAVAAERAGKGRGVRALVHPRLHSLLTDQLTQVLQPIEVPDKRFEHELRWSSDLSGIWPNMERLNIGLPVPGDWYAKIRELLAHGPAFEWNRQSREGQVRLFDTAAFLAAAER